MDLSNLSHGPCSTFPLAHNASPRISLTWLARIPRLKTRKECENLSVRALLLRSGSASRVPRRSPGSRRVWSILVPAALYPARISHLEEDTGGRERKEGSEAARQRVKKPDRRCCRRRRPGPFHRHEARYLERDSPSAERSRESKKEPEGGTSERGGSEERRSRLLVGLALDLDFQNDPNSVSRQGNGGGVAGDGCSIHSTISGGGGRVVHRRRNK